MTEALSSQAEEAIGFVVEGSCPLCKVPSGSTMSVPAVRVAATATQQPRTDSKLDSAQSTVVAASTGRLSGPCRCREMGEHEEKVVAIPR